MIFSSLPEAILLLIGKLVCDILLFLDLPPLLLFRLIISIYSIIFILVLILCANTSSWFFFSILISSFKFFISSLWASFISLNSLPTLLSFSTISLFKWSISSYSSTLSLFKVYISNLKLSILSSKAWTSSLWDPECRASKLNFCFGADCLFEAELLSLSTLNFGWFGGLISLNLKTVSRHKFEASMTCKVGSTFFCSGLSIIYFNCSAAEALFFLSSYFFNSSTSYFDSIIWWRRYSKSFSSSWFLSLSDLRSSFNFFSRSDIYGIARLFSDFLDGLISYYDRSEKVTFLSFNLLTPYGTLLLFSSNFTDLSELRMDFTSFGSSDWPSAFFKDFASNLSDSSSWSYLRLAENTFYFSISSNLLTFS